MPSRISHEPALDPPWIRPGSTPDPPRTRPGPDPDPTLTRPRPDLDPPRTRPGPNPDPTRTQPGPATDPPRTHSGPDPSRTRSGPAPDPPRSPPRSVLPGHHICVFWAASVTEKQNSNGKVSATRVIFKDASRRYSSVRSDCRLLSCSTVSDCNFPLACCSRETESSF